MATEVKVIKVRRGPYTDFDKTKMNAGEPAVTTSGDPNALDGKGVYMGVGPGQVKQAAMIEDIEDILNAAVDGAVDEATQQAEAEADRAEAAATQLASTVTQVTTNTANIAQLNERMGNVFSDDAKAALLACFENVGWKPGTGREYINALESALYPNMYPKITATINQTGEVFDTDDLSIIRQYLTVKYFETEESTGENVTTYTLEGNLTIGTSQIAVKYEGLRANVSVNVVAFYVEPDFSIGAPSATTSAFAYTPNTIRACMNPIAIDLPAGTYNIEHSAGDTYYYAYSVLKYNESQYSPDFSYTQGTAKTFMTSGMTYAYPTFADGTNGWQNVSKSIVVTDDYTRIFINVKKGTAGTDSFSASDITALNGHIVFRRVG